MTTNASPATTGYHYLPGVMQYSGGVRADDGFELVRCRFQQVVPMAEGFERAKTELERHGVPLTALCATEIRSPEPFTEDGFLAFNQEYHGILQDWGIVGPGASDNPVARSNVCPQVDPPAVPSLFAFTFARPSDDSDGSPTFVISGSGEAPEGKSNYADHIVAPGDTSADGIRAKADFVVGELTRRLTGLGLDWSGVLSTQLYSVFDCRPVLDAGQLRPAAGADLIWQYCRPPIEGLDFEMDCRRVVEHVLPGGLSA